MVLFFGSSIGLGILMMPSKSSKSGIPKTILLSDISPSQEQNILSMGGTIIYFNHDTTCDYCDLLKDKLLEVANKLQPFVFIVYKESNETSIRIVNRFGENMVNSGGMVEIMRYACSSIPPGTKQYEYCVDYLMTAPTEMNKTEG